MAPKGSIILKESVIDPGKTLSPQEAGKSPVKRKAHLKEKSPEVKKALEQKKAAVKEKEPVKEKDIVPTDIRVMGPKKAADQGDASAQFILGRMYSNGTGVTQNYQLAYVWESLAAAQGHEFAIFLY